MTTVASADYAPREIRRAPSTTRTAHLKQRYLDAPLMVDVEYIRLLTESHRATEGMETLERRAENHAFALERMTPRIHDGDRLAGNKTRFVRGVIRSSSKVDHRRIRGGLLNLKFHPTALRGQSGSSNLLALIQTYTSHGKALRFPGAGRPSGLPMPPNGSCLKFCPRVVYFEKPGFHVQFNVVDSNMLRRTQAEPERFRDLVVRVAGFSAYWVEMSPALQIRSSGVPSTACDAPAGVMSRGLVFDIQHYAVHDGPGIRTLVFLTGCPLRCSWCCNPESQVHAPALRHAASRCRRCLDYTEACPSGAARAGRDGPTFDRRLCADCAT